MVGQFPNVAITLFVVLTLIGFFVDDEGGWGTALYVGTRFAVLWWAGDELLRGVNPFRRVLGAGVIVFVTAGILTGL